MTGDQDQLAVGSLCSGYGGLEIGVGLVLPTRVAWHVEHDAAPSRILAHHWPDVPNHGDVIGTDWTTVEPVDVLTAGYPCQPFSHAGHRKGTDDVRHLWPHVARAVGVLRPRLVILENVAGHLSLGFGDVIGDLAALGYDARWGVLRASDAGAPHGRARLFILAAPAPDTDGQRHGRGEDTAGVGRVARADAGAARQRQRARAVPRGGGATALADPARVGRGEGWAEPAGRAGGSATLVGGGAPAADAGHDGRGEGHARRSAPQESGPAGARPAADADRERRDRREEQHAPAQAGEHGGDGGHPDGRDADPRWGAYAAAVHRWERVTGRPAPAAVEPTGRDGGPRLSPRFVEWMMGLQAGHVTDVPDLSRAAMLKALGNGVVPQQAALAVSTLLAMGDE